MTSKQRVHTAIILGFPDILSVGEIHFLLPAEKSWIPFFKGMTVVMFEL